MIGVEGSSSCGAKEPSGIFMEELHSVLEKKEISATFHGISYERLDEDIAKLEKLIK